MIKTDAQRERTLVQLEGFRRARASTEKQRSAKRSAAVRASYEGVIRQLEEEVREYDQLKAGGFTLGPVQRLDQIAPAIVRLRIAKGISQTELARRLGVSAHVISRCEDSDYQTVAVGRLQEILDAPEIYAPLTKLQCSPTSDGSGAAILASEAFVEKHGLDDQAVEIVGQSMVTDMTSTFEDRSAQSLVGKEMTRQAAKNVYEQTGISAEEVDVIELHDCFSANELITYEALGLCEEGKAGTLVDAEATTYGGKWVVNPSGGLISKGHPLGATGLAQCAELNWQLRGLADERQIDGARVGLQHNIGLGGACVVTLYRRD